MSDISRDKGEADDMAGFENKVLGFIGAGNMNGAILRGVLGQGLVTPDRVWLSNRHPEKLEPFAAEGVHTTTDNTQVAAQADLIVLGVKPQMFPDVLPELAGLTAGKCVVSIAAGISSEALRRALPGALVVRAMPNTPLMVGVGATAVARAENMPAELFQTVLDLFSAAGAVAVIEEDQMDDIINVNGSSPAWFFRMADVMVRRAVSVGIDAKTALTLTAKTMEGSARLLLESGKTPEELCRQVCSPGVTTLASLSAFEDRDFDGLMLDAMDRCTRRSKELGK